MGAKLVVICWAIAAVCSAVNGGATLFITESSVPVIITNLVENYLLINNKNNLATNESYIILLSFKYDAGLKRLGKKRLSHTPLISVATKRVTVLPAQLQEGNHDGRRHPGPRPESAVLPRLAPQPPATAAAASPPIPPAGFTVDAAPPGDRRTPGAGGAGSAPMRGRSRAGSRVDSGEAAAGSGQDLP